LGLTPQSLVIFYNSPLANSFKYMNSGAFTPARSRILINPGDSKKFFASEIDDHLQK